MLTTSSEKRDIELCNRLGAVSFFTKPGGYGEWLAVMGAITRVLKLGESERGRGIGESEVVIRVLELFILSKE